MNSNIWNHLTECKRMLNKILSVGSSVALFYGVSTLFGLFNAELIHLNKSFKQFSLV